MTSEYINRERIYIVAFLDEKLYHNFDFPYPVKLEKSLQDLIDFKNKVDNKYYYTEENCSFYIQLETEMKNKNTHRISYMLQMEDDLLLECGLEIHQPNSKKKIDEKLLQGHAPFAGLIGLRQ